MKQECSVYRGRMAANSTQFVSKRVLSERGLERTLRRRRLGASHSRLQSYELHGHRDFEEIRGKQTKLLDI